MRLLLLAGILAVSATAACAFDVSIMPLKARTIIDFKDQFSNTVSKGGVGVAVAETEHVRGLQARYSYSPSASGEAVLTPPPLLVVNGKDFGKKQDTTTAANGKEADQIAIEWSVRPSHIVELEVGQLGIIRPLLVVDSQGGQLTATGKIDGKLQSSTEEFSQTFVGIGARARSYASQGLWVDAGLAVGSGYENAEVSASVRLARGVNVGMGYRHRVMRFRDEITVRSNIGFGEIGIRF